VCVCVCVCVLLCYLLCASAALACLLARRRAFMVLQRRVPSQSPGLRETCGGSDCKCERVRTMACAQLRALTHRLLLPGAAARARAGQTATTTATHLGALRRLENCRRVVKIRLLADAAVALLGAGRAVALRTLAERGAQEIRSQQECVIPVTHFLCADI
jgi:hypothetical protein